MDEFKNHSISYPILLVFKNCTVILIEAILKIGNCMKCYFLGMLFNQIRDLFLKYPDFTKLIFRSPSMDTPNNIVMIFLILELHILCDVYIQ